MGVEGAQWYTLTRVWGPKSGVWGSLGRTPRGTSLHSPNPTSREASAFTAHFTDVETEVQRHPDGYVPGLPGDRVTEPGPIPDTDPRACALGFTQSYERRTRPHPLPRPSPSAQRHPQLTVLWTVLRKAPRRTRKRDPEKSSMCLRTHRTRGSGPGFLLLPPGPSASRHKEDPEVCPEPQPAAPPSLAGHPGSSLPLINSPSGSFTGSFHGSRGARPQPTLWAPHSGSPSDLTAHPWLRHSPAFPTSRVSVSPDLNAFLASPRSPPWLPGRPGAGPPLPGSLPDHLHPSTGGPAIPSGQAQAHPLLPEESLEELHSRVCSRRV